jgi:phosphate uptake regulator
MSKRTPGRPSAPDEDERTVVSRPAVRRGRAVPALPPAPAHCSVERGEPPEHLFRCLLSAYLGGADAFEVEERPAISAATREVVREFCRRTVGPEVVRTGRDRLALEDRGREAPGSIDDALRALGDRVVGVHREAVDSWDRLAFGGDAEWERRDDEVDREAWHLERRIAREEREGRGTGRPATAAWTIARSLERIADHAVTLGEVGPRLADLGPDDSPRRELRQYHRQAMAHLSEVLAAPDGTRANELLDVGEALLTAGRALSEQLLPAVGDGTISPAAAAAVARALEAIGRTVAYGQDIAQAYFDRSAAPTGGVVPAPTPVAALAVPG